MKMKNPRLVSLKTDFENNLNKTLPFSEYPRPRLRRNSYYCLNGEWDFKIENNGNTKFSGKIVVPFVPESRISNVEKDIAVDDILIYERDFELEQGFLKDRVILHIGACDQFCEVFVNENFVGKNVGGYLPFSFDITDFLKNGTNSLKVIASDPLDIELPYGKQTSKRGGMWYTKISGIWQTVWLESVPEKYIEKIKISSDLCGVDIEIIGGEYKKTIIFEGNEYSFCGSKYRLDVDPPELWTPENPKLYDFAIISGKDCVESYFGLRTVGVCEVDGKSFIALNGKPYYFHGLLDQGYFSDGIFLPATEEGFRRDILTMKKCGFNMLRKHIKLEPEIFYYYCDKFGMIVFQDMINSGKYNFLIDTALPTVFLKKGISHRATKRRREEFEKTSFGMVELLYNHPSVVYYTVFNEGWGQFDADNYYEKFKSLDPSRIIDTTSGWFKEKMSDVESDHVYFKTVKLKSKKGRPMVLSEFGGYSLKIEEHSFNLDNNYGYKTFNTPEDFENALVKLYETEIMENMENGLCATVLTQVSDVEDETNGLFTYDRKVLKVSEERMKKLSEKVFLRFGELFAK